MFCVFLIFSSCFKLGMKKLAIVSFVLGVLEMVFLNTLANTFGEQGMRSRHGPDRATNSSMVGQTIAVLPASAPTCWPA